MFQVLLIESNRRAQRVIANAFDVVAFGISVMTLTHAGDHDAVPIDDIDLVVWSVDYPTPIGADDFSRKVVASNSSLPVFLITPDTDMSAENLPPPLRCLQVHKVLHRPFDLIRLIDDIVEELKTRHPRKKLPGQQ